MNENIQNEPENQENKGSQKSNTEPEEHESDLVSQLSKVSKSSENENNHRNIEVIQETNDKADLSFKVIIIGDSFVGKSSLANKAVKNKFETGYSATLGFDYFSFFVRIDKKILKLQIWDTCGQEIYNSLISNFYRNSSLAIMVYGINNRASFEHIDNWLKEIKISSNPDAKIILIGNKNDLEDERKVTYEEAKQYAEDLEFSNFFETSAKSGFNAQKVFLEAANLLYDEYIEYKTSSQGTSSISQISGEKLINDKESRDERQSRSKECC